MIAASQSSYRWRSRPLSPEFQLEHSAGTLVHHPAAPTPTHSMLPSSDMSATPQFTTAAYGMAAVLAWGTSDFLGGYATRRANAFLFTVVVNIGGLLVVGTLTSATHAPIPSARSAAWVLAGGLSGGAALAIFYRALSSGRMGLTAPVAAVLGAAIPAVFSMYHEGLPGKIPLLGFFFAAIGLWLITRTEDGGPPEGIGLAVLAGIGFASFYLCVRQAGDASAFWIASLTRAGGLIITGLIVLLLRNFTDITPAGVRWGVLTGCIDSLGTMLFVHASQTGRLDEAVVISSLYPAVTVLLARLFLKEHFTRWRLVGLLAALAAVPMIAAQ
jgi:drug/metabolite transporter (DMT)-like permease